MCGNAFARFSFPANFRIMNLLHFVKLVYINNMRKKKQNAKTLGQTWQFSINYVLIQKINEKEIKITP